MRTVAVEPVNTLVPISVPPGELIPHSPDDTVFCDRPVVLSYKIQHLVRD
jgi:hypothetical protein